MDDFTGYSIAQDKVKVGTRARTPLLSINPILTAFY
jgi:hypothetical protein